MAYFNSYPHKVLIANLSDGTPIYETVNSDDEFDALMASMDAERERVREYFKQYQ